MPFLTALRFLVPILEASVVFLQVAINVARSFSSAYAVP